MRVSVRDTGEFFLVDGVRCRKWAGTTDDGVPISLYTVAVACRRRDIAAMVAAGLAWLKPDHSNAVIEPVLGPPS